MLILNKAVSQIEIMDTGVAFLAGMMIIPAVFVFSGLDGMSAGPGLMFVSLPNVFFRMGMAGRIVGLLFFLLADFAALTSCISVLESITANCMELFHTEEKENNRRFIYYLFNCNSSYSFRLQYFLCGSKTSKRKHRSAFGYYGLH